MNTTEVAADYWEKMFSSRTWGAYPPEELVRFIARNFRSASVKSDIRVLEVGCGPGPNIWYLVREGYTVSGIDGSETAIRQACVRLMQERLPYEMPRVDLRAGNFVTLPWVDESFDAIIDIEALYANSMGSIRASIGEIWRTLKPGGRFFGKMFGDQSTGSRSGVMIEPGTMHRPEVGPCAGNEIAHFFSREEFNDLFTGFHDLCIDHTCRTDRNGEIKIFEWLISARK